MAAPHAAPATPVTGQLSDPNYTPPLTRAVPLAIQHVLAMFISNVTPAIIIMGAAGFGAFETPFEYAPMVQWAKQHGMITTVHTGGSSIPGSSGIWADHLLAMQPVVRRDGEQFDQRGRAIARPVGSGNGPVVDADAEPAEQVDRNAQTGTTRTGAATTSGPAGCRHKPKAVRER